MFTADALTDEALQRAFDYCLTEDARAKARECRERATRMAREVRERFISSLDRSYERTEN